ncbi:hypothetical protein LEN26_008436 [Aphanomyces euteiches]|nr:hypothetical protein AeMF1_004942 [Aphanomyces euteiches]KAH9130508.1 hypothetical protein LEN26_008436 [Aphanomyces euteiches]KAH9183400.1 hypothetical protein AeNC1_014624 [Aphanomyces euteiches]
MATTPLRLISTHQDAMKGLKQTSSLKRKPLATLSTNVLAQEEAERGTPVKKRKTEEWEDADIDNPTRRDEVNMAWLDMCCALLTKKRTDLPTKVIDPTDQLPELDLPCKGTPSKPRTISPVPSQDEVDPRDVDVINAAKTLHEQSQPSVTCCGCKTGCLKLYCRCFLTRGFCTAQCSCATCLNTKTSAQRLPAIIMHLKNNINAFRASSHTTPQLPGGNTDHGSMGLGSKFVPMIPNVKTMRMELRAAVRNLNAPRNTAIVSKLESPVVLDANAATAAITQQEKATRNKLCMLKTRSKSL